MEKAGELLAGKSPAATGQDAETCHAVAKACSSQPVCVAGKTTLRQVAALIEAFVAALGIGPGRISILTECDPDIVEALGLQENERIHGPVVIGYPKIVPEPPPKKAPM